VGDPDRLPEVPKWQEAVKAVQRANGIQPTGKVGGRTWDALEAAATAKPKTKAQAKPTLRPT